jgi:hypothetical protein
MVSSLDKSFTAKLERAKGPLSIGAANKHTPFVKRRRAEKNFMQAAQKDPQARRASKGLESRV